LGRNANLTRKLFPPKRRSVAMWRCGGMREGKKLKGRKFPQLPEDMCAWTLWRVQEKRHQAQTKRRKREGVV